MPVGPFTAEQIIQSWRSAKIGEKTMCWHEGMDQWLPLTLVEPFASVTRSPSATSRPPTNSVKFSPLPQGMPPVPFCEPSSPTRFNLSIIISCAAGGIGFLIIVAAVLVVTSGRGSSAKVSRNGSKASSDSGEVVARGDNSALAMIIRDYAMRLREVYQAQSTEIQRTEAIASAVEELKARVSKCGSVAFTGKVLEIIQEGPSLGGQTRDRWGISMSLPQEFEPLVREGACTFGCKVWIELKRRDALSISKGDPITVRGAVSYIEGSVLFGNHCVAIQVWPNSEDSVTKVWGLGNLGSPRTIVVPASDSVTCSVGPFKSLRVHNYLGD